jgi:3-hydroxybutyryl-CoA dehydrogenase
MAPSFERVAVIGFGTMGSGIAQVIAQSGRSVVVVETGEARLRAGRALVENFLAKSVELGKLAEHERAEALDRIHGTTQLAEIADADLIIEAVVEQKSVKDSLLRAVGGIARPNAVLATNTSAISVTDLAAAVPSPDRFAGLHFFNPAQLMKLVEVVRALQTDNEVLAKLMSFCTEIGKVPVEVKDRPGFLLNRLLMPYLNDVVQAYDDGLATAHDIDLAIEQGLGHPMGPLRLLDKIGLDVHHHATSSAYESTLDAQFAPPPLLGRMIAAGWLGDKAGRGFRSTDGSGTNTEGEP